jgi:phospholipid transport system substrate-binding protein
MVRSAGSKGGMNFPAGSFWALRRHSGKSAGPNQKLDHGFRGNDINQASLRELDPRRLKLLRFLALAMLLFSLLPPPRATAGDSATQVIENLHTELLEVMKTADALGYTGRYERLAPVITSTYDLPFIAKTVVGRYWKKFTPEQKSKFVETFTRMSIATYADRFDGYSGELFKTISEQPLRRGRLVVKTILIKSSGEQVQLDYILHQNSDQWQVINVIAQGVSDLSLKRADYTSYLKKRGFDDLLSKINTKIEHYEK